jgi:radical SAM protein with 4Fe4S-binding SPASM domain
LKELPTETILDLLDQVQAMGFRERVTFYHYSEPLLDKRNIMLAREAKRRGMKPYLHTNGDVLRRDNAMCEEVKRVYGLIVVGLYDYNTNEQLEEAKRYWQDRLAGANLKFSAIGISAARSAFSNGIPKALVPTDPRMGAPDLTFDNAPCHRPMIRMIIQHDGEMCNCCEDAQGAFRLGNVFQSSVKELWFSDRHVQAVTDLIAGRRAKYDLCRNCPLPPTSPAPDGGKIEIAPRNHRTGATAVAQGS